MATFNSDSIKYLGVEVFKECMGDIDLSVTDFENDWDPIDPPLTHPHGPRPESLKIALPSALPMQFSYRLSLTRLMMTELELRKGHANDCLAAMRTTIGQEAYQYKKILWPAHSKEQRTRARSSIQNVHRALILQTRVYNQTRKAMLGLGMELNALNTIYQVLTKTDIQVSSAIADPIVAGSSQTRLSWIWTTHKGVEANDNHLTECEFFQFGRYLAHQDFLVYRVHWLRARAQLHRWQEEVTLTRNEMHWAINYFTFRQKEWDKWQSSYLAMTPGHHAYAEHQKAMWAEIREQPRQLFKMIWADFNSDTSVFT